MSREAAAKEAAEAPNLPAGFTEIDAILRDDEVAAGSFVNIIGLVTDYRLPMPTPGKGLLFSFFSFLLFLILTKNLLTNCADFKSTLTLNSLSADGLGHGIDFVIFRPESDMPPLGAAADVVVIYKARVQNYKSTTSLICHHTTKIAMYSASKIPKPPASAKSALVPATKRDNQVPTDEVHHYISYAYHETDRYDVPDDVQFQQKTAASLNIKSKFSLLKDVKDGQFCDLVVQVARKPFDLMDKMTLYVSDYTENSNFFHYTIDDISTLKAKSDPYGYMKSQSDPSKEKDPWVGPYGKKAIQITCYDPHAEFVRRNVLAGQWLLLRNVHIKYGRDGQNLEGYMRASQNFAAHNNVDILDSKDPESIDPRLKEAIRRWRDETKKRKQQIKEIEAATIAGTKRKATQALGDLHPRESLSKGQKKKLKKKAKRQEEAARQQGTAPRQNGGADRSGDFDQSGKIYQSRDEELSPIKGNLNKFIIHESPRSVSVSSIASILQPRLWTTEINGQQVQIPVPFVCAKYQAQVRVVDYFPPNIEDFACSRRSTEFDVLSDISDDESSSDSSDAGSDSETGRIWEWRFALRLEDASDTSASKQRIWVLVNNAEAQCLTDLDAADLRRNRKTLSLLRERMFTLWGDLEERKRQVAAGKRRAKQPALRSGGRTKFEMPPIDESGNEDNEEVIDGLSNKPFICCIKQYGVLKAKESSTESDSSESETKDEWMRVFGLFGTKINIA